MKHFCLLAIAILVVLGLAGAPAEAAEKACIKDHNAVKTHIHVQLFFIVGIQMGPLFSQQSVPAPEGVGITEDCVNEIHTHDGTGVVHIESYTADKKFTLAELIAALAGDGFKNYDKTESLIVVNGRQADMKAVVENGMFITIFMVMPPHTDSSEPQPERKDMT